MWSSAGADRHPELLADLFTCLSNIFKHLTKHIVPQLTSVLHDSVGLTYHPAPHVRQLAANAVGYLFRHTGESGLKAGVQTVLSEATARPLPGKHYYVWAADVRHKHAACDVCPTVACCSCCHLLTCCHWICASCGSNVLIVCMQLHRHSSLLVKSAESAAHLRTTVRMT